MSTPSPPPPPPPNTERNSSEYKHVHLYKYPLPSPPVPLLLVGITYLPGPQSVLRATRDKAIVDLRNRTRIFVPDAACLLGVIDETGLLQPEEASELTG